MKAMALIQGFISFFSPCVLPLIPVYFGIFAGGLPEDAETFTQTQRLRVFRNCLLFILGVCCSFFLLGLSASVLGQLFLSRQTVFILIGGIFIILFGIYQLDVLPPLPFLEKDRHLSFSVDGKFGAGAAFLMGFFTSFGWTPCIGPTLTSILILTASETDRSEGLLLTLLYTLGFIVPFLLLGLFAGKALQLFKNLRPAIRYIKKIGGILLIVTGLLLVSGQFNRISAFFGAFAAESSWEENDASDTEGTSDGSDAIATDDGADTSGADENGTETNSDTDTSNNEEDSSGYAATDFSLTDQYGNTLSLSDYSGQVVVLNFWATWCPYCVAEMPDLQTLSEEYAEQGVVVLGVAFPGINGEGSAEEIASYLEENGITYPVLMDEEASLLYAYGITSFPYTYIINADGNIDSYIPGAVSYETLEKYVTRAF